MAPEVINFDEITCNTGKYKEILNISTLYKTKY